MNKKCYQVKKKYTYFFLIKPAEKRTFIDIQNGRNGQWT